MKSARAKSIGPPRLFLGGKRIGWHSAFEQEPRKRPYVQAGIPDPAQETVPPELPLKTSIEAGDALAANFFNGIGQGRASHL